MKQRTRLQTPVGDVDDDDSSNVPTRLATAIVDRRAELELSTVDVANRAGISRSTLHRIETGQPSRLMARTLAQLDRALEWQTGTCRALANGDLSAGRPERRDPLIRRLDMIVSTLSPDQVRAVIGFAERVTDSTTVEYDVADLRKQLGEIRRLIEPSSNGS